MSAELTPAVAESTIRTSEQQAILEKLFTRIGEVSSLPTAATRIFQVATDESIGAAELLSVVEGDPALAVRILRTVNSGYYGLADRVNNLKHAIMLIGFKQVRNLALTVHVSRMFSSPGDYYTYSREGLWQHHVAVASTARLIATVCDDIRPDDVYVAGLLHDIGLILIDQHLRPHFKRVLDRLNPSAPTTAIERDILTFDHAELGWFVTKRWNLPEAVSAAAGFHHAPEIYTGPEQRIVNVVAIANYLCSQRNLTSLGVANLAAPTDRVFHELGIDAALLETILSRLDETLEFAALAMAI